MKAAACCNSGEIDSRLVGYSVSIIVPPVGKSTYSFSLEWNKWKQRNAKTEHEKNQSNATGTTGKDSASNNLSKKSYQAAVIHPFDNFNRPIQNVAKFNKSDREPSRKGKTIDGSVSVSENMDNSRKVSKCVNNNEKRSQKFKNADWDNYISAEANCSIRDSFKENLSYSLDQSDSRVTEKNSESSRDCIRLVNVNLVIRYFSSNGKIIQKEFQGETQNFTTVLNALKFLLRNVSLPSMVNRFGRLFLIRNIPPKQQIKEMSFKLYANASLEQVSQMFDEYFFVLDLTNSFNQTSENDKQFFAKRKI